MKGPRKGSYAWRLTEAQREIERRGLLRCPAAWQRLLEEAGYAVPRLMTGVDKGFIGRRTKVRYAGFCHGALYALLDEGRKRTREDRIFDLRSYLQDRAALEAFVALRTLSNPPHYRLSLPEVAGG